MRLGLIIVGAALAMLQLSCASMSKEECQMGNWYDYGHRDSSKGGTSDMFMQHSEACMKHGISGNKEQYMAGFKEGLKEFCTPENAYQFGVGGGQYKNTCPPALHSKFNMSYKKGKEIYDINSQINSLQGEVDRLSNDMVDPKLTSNERTKAAFDLREKERRKSELEKRLLVIEMKEEMKKN
jgi:hypothetical protein